MSDDKWQQQYAMAMERGSSGFQDGSSRRFALTDKERFEVRQIVREQLYAITIEGNRQAIDREAFEVGRQFRTRPIPDGPDGSPRVAQDLPPSPEIRRDGVWEHICDCGDTKRTITFPINTDRCGCCGIERDVVLQQTLPDRRDEVIGKVIDRREDELGFWFTILLDKGWVVRDGRVERPQTSASTDE